MFNIPRKFVGVYVRTGSNSNIYFHLNISTLGFGIGKKKKGLWIIMNFPQTYAYKVGMITVNQIIIILL